MAAKPGRVTCLDYGLRWGIEAMFSDYKSLRLRPDAEPDPTPDLAGKTDSNHGDSDVLGGLLRACGRSRVAPQPGIKKNTRSLCSLFKRGLRFFKRYFALAVRLPKLWGRWNL